MQRKTEQRPKFNLSDDKSETAAGRYQAVSPLSDQERRLCGYKVGQKEREKTEREREKLIVREVQ